ncbi:MAG: Rab family GTPase [Candidatus Heimdallarchaeota archaeon]|nr:Rab family GTPase [Candidatus Heimdallarchaeota archaeon]
MSSIFRRDAEGIPTIKLTVFGPSLAGKTSLLSIYSILKKVENPEHVYSELKKIDDPSGRTALFDQSVFELPKGQGTSLPLMRYALYSVAGQERYRETRKVVLRGTDGLMVMLDPTKDQYDNNKNSLVELMELLGKELTSGLLPWILVVNKIDLPKEDRNSQQEFLDLMVSVGLVKDVGEAYEKYMEMSCLEARNDLLAMPRQPDWKEKLDSSGRLRRDSRPPSVILTAQPIESLTRLVIEHKIQLIRSKK